MRTPPARDQAYPVGRLGVTSLHPIFQAEVSVTLLQHRLSLHLA